VCGYGMPCHYSSRPPFSAPLSDKQLVEFGWLQTCLRSDRPRLVLHVGSSWWLVPGPARAAAAREHENRRICQRRRRRGGAELSAARHCPTTELAQASIRSSAALKTHVRPCRKYRLVVRLSGSASSQGSIIRDTAETHASPPESALSGCRHASAIAVPGIARRQAVTRACSAGM
jgi:hypothetical protein